MSERVDLKNGHGTVALSDCSPNGDGYKYVDKGGCPKCGGNLDIFIRKSRAHQVCDWVGFAERCVNYDDCDHRIP